VTAAEVKAPPVPPAPPAASVPTAGRLAAGARLAWLHQRSRRAPAALLALALCGGALRAVQLWHLMSGGALEQQGPMVIETGAVQPRARPSIIAVFDYELVSFRGNSLAQDFELRANGSAGLLRLGRDPRVDCYPHRRVLWATVQSKGVRKSSS